MLKNIVTIAIAAAMMITLIVAVTPFDLQTTLWTLGFFVFVFLVFGIGDDPWSDGY